MGLRHMCGRRKKNLVPLRGVAQIANYGCLGLNVAETRQGSLIDSHEKRARSAPGPRLKLICIGIDAVESM